MSLQQTLDRDFNRPLSHYCALKSRNLNIWNSIQVWTEEWFWNVKKKMFQVPTSTALKIKALAHIKSIMYFSCSGCWRVGRVGGLHPLPDVIQIPKFREKVWRMKVNDSKIGWLPKQLTSTQRIHFDVTAGISLRAIGISNSKIQALLEAYSRFLQNNKGSQATFIKQSTFYLSFMFTHFYCLLSNTL